MLKIEGIVRMTNNIVSKHIRQRGEIHIVQHKVVENNNTDLLTFTVL